MNKIVFAAAILARVRRCSLSPNHTGSIQGWKYTCGCNPRQQKSDCAR
ncbi:hypothetical protein ACVIGV_001962 [Rhizobium leguminosarum]